MKEEIYNIETLGKMTGLNRRTIRYYIQRGILQRPHGGGRGHYYTGEHVQRIREIQRLRQQGVPIEKMREIFSVAGEEPVRMERIEPPPPVSSDIREETWQRIVVWDGVEIAFRDGALSEEEKRDILNDVMKTLTQRGKNDA